MFQPRMACRWGPRAPQVAPRAKSKTSQIPLVAHMVDNLPYTVDNLPSTCLLCVPHGWPSGVQEAPKGPTKNPKVTKIIPKSSTWVPKGGKMGANSSPNAQKTHTNL